MNLTFLLALTFVPFPIVLDDPAPADEKAVALTTVSYETFRDRVDAAEPGVKVTLVDAWATYCPPCKENFPHLVAMHETYGAKGLRVFSLSLDDAEDTDAVAEAEKFLKSKGATFTNFLIEGDPGDTYDALDINAIPAVFVFGPDGEELKRFTLDDVNNQFTYEQVEEYVKDLLSKAESSK